MRKLLKLLVLAPLTTGVLALSGRGAGQTPIPEGMDINNPDGKLGPPKHMRAVPDRGGNLPGASEGASTPQSTGQ